MSILKPAMKISTFLVGLLILVMAAVACQPATESPKQVMQVWLTHMATGNIDQVMELSVPATREILKVWETEGFNFYKNATFESIHIEMQSDSLAVGSFLLNGEQSELQAVKIDGKWLVQMVK